jgi:diketogulonate reductase-like aldo/keto reductase
MEELVHKGLCKAIGVSNLTSTKVKALLETAKIVPATNQGDDLILLIIKEFVL